MRKNDKIQLLLVEDDREFGDALSSRLIKRNFEITIAVSAEEALEKFGKIPLDIIVADIKLPGMNGLEFLYQVRQIDEDLPVILITGYASLDSAKEAVTLRATDYLLKPLEKIDDLLNPVKKAVHAHTLCRENKILLEKLQVKIEELGESKDKYKAMFEIAQKHELDLAKKNLVLKEIFNQMELEKRCIEDNISANVEKLLLPAMKKLKGKLEGSQTKYLNVLESNLKELTSSFGRRITDRAMILTPREIEIANMIKVGFTSKEIAENLNISLQTAERHRNNIRTKFDIVNKNINLVTYLQQMA